MKTRRIILVLLLSATFLNVWTQNAAKYELKSAMIRKEVIMAGIKINTVQYIDEYGEKESVEMSIPNGISEGVDKHLRTLVDSISIITIDSNSKKAKKMTLPEKPVNYLQLTPEIREKYKIKEIGEEEIAGKKCQKYSLEIQRAGQTVHAMTWIWKGLVLKSEMSANGMVFSIETAIAIQENVPVPEDKFEIPEGIVIQ